MAWSDHCSTARRARMVSSFCSVASVFLLASADIPDPAGYLLLKPEGVRTADTAAVIPYEPREGDLIFYDDHSKVWTALFKIAGTGPPLHMGIVVRKPNGRLAVLEAGPDDTVWVDLRDLVPRLHQFTNDYSGDITIRRAREPLDRFQSAALTHFAMAQNGKRYAVVRLL